MGPQGLLQFLADGIKSLLKEDLIPKDADSPLFRLAPYLVFLGMFTSFVVLPFAGKLVVSDLNVGLLYLFATSAITAASEGNTYKTWVAPRSSIPASRT